jgi:hypothetical protein
MNPSMNPEVNAALDGNCLTSPSTLQRMNIQVDLPEELAVKLQAWADEHGALFEAALETAVLSLFVQTLHSPSPSISVFSPEHPQ